MLAATHEHYLIGLLKVTCARSREFHRSLRNAWQPAFVSDSLEGYSALMNAAMDRLIRRLARAAAQEKEVDVWRYLGQMTTDVVGTASFGCTPLQAPEHASTVLCPHAHCALGHAASSCAVEQSSLTCRLCLGATHGLPPWLCQGSVLNDPLF